MATLSETIISSGDYLIMAMVMQTNVARMVMLTRIVTATSSTSTSCEIEKSHRIFAIFIFLIITTIITTITMMMMGSAITIYVGVMIPTSDRFSE